MKNKKTRVNDSYENFERLRKRNQNAVIQKGNATKLGGNNSNIVTPHKGNGSKTKK